VDQPEVRSQKAEGFFIFVLIHLRVSAAEMPYIAPLKPEEIRDPELQALIERCEALGVPDALFPRILARAPAHAKALLRALLVSHAEGNVDHRLKEIIRVQLARIAGDPYFARLRSRKAQQAGLDEEIIEAGSKKPDDDPRFTAAEKWALRYAREMYLNPERVDAAFYDEGKRHYTEAQIMELGAFIAFHYGMQAFMRTLGAQPQRDSG
jgi:alkylhydroperoxidase family enzyme